MARVSIDALDQFVTWGNPEQCLERLSQYLNIGAKTFVLLNLNPNYEEFYRLVGKEIIPHLKRA